MFPGFIIFSTSGETVNQIDLIVRSIFEDIFFYDFDKHFAGNKLAFSHKLPDMDGFLAISFDEFSEKITSGEMVEAILFDHVCTLGTFSGARSSQNENNLRFVFFLKHKLKKINLKDRE